MAAFKAVVTAYTAAMPFRIKLIPQRVPLAIPRVLSLRDAYDDTLRVINELRSLVLENYTPGSLYFDQLEEVEPAAAMVLTAEIHRCRNLRKRDGQSLVSGTYPNNDAVYWQLQGLGFFRLLMILEEKSSPSSLKNSDKLVLPFISNAQVLPERVAGFIADVVKVVNSTIPMDGQSQRYLYGAIIEAMKNAGEHAYKAHPRFQPMGRRWWMTAAFDRAQREASILLFDQGIGIPSTLDPDLVDRMEAMAKLDGLTPSDSLMIEIAARAGRTSTEQAGRGQGFRTMRKFVDACDEGHLLVYSNRGHYMHHRGGSQRVDREQSLGGTLIELRVRHSSSTVRVVA